MTFPWSELVEVALRTWPTPFYLSAWDPIETALDELTILNGRLPVRHWLSFKTQPLAPLVRLWRKAGRGVEVVSEFEFLAAIKEGFKPNRIIVNGVAKHSWIHRHDTKGLWVHFDSLQEVEQLALQAKTCGWHIGFRFHVAEEYDPDEPRFSGQFGMVKDEIIAAVAKLREYGVSIESAHFHLRSNVSSADSYRRAIKEVANICQAAECHPLYLDCGGGLPVPGERLEGAEGGHVKFDLAILRQVLDDVPSVLPNTREIWFENGRFITARSAVLVLRVLDIKDRPDSRYLICNGGRTNNALVSDWEVHDIFTLPSRGAHQIMTTICGPTCMAFDRLARINLPENIQIGDHVVWMNAGAYHIPWETRFSHGLARVIWCDERGELLLARNAERFSQWWGQWL